MINPFSIFDNQAHGVCVECGASGGGDGNRTHQYINRGWKTILIEQTDWKFNDLSRFYANKDNVLCVHDTITPKNVHQLVKDGVDIFVLDIDGYDYEVLDALMTHCNVKVFEVEINEKIPPPVRFYVKYEQNYVWRGDHFYGMSIASLEDLCKKHGYKIVGGNIYNMWLMKGGEAVDIEKYFDDQCKPFNNSNGYNSNVARWMYVSPEDAVNDITHFYNGLGYTDKFHISLGAK
jgi:hypothetical protein